jgi:hypothetical protein
MPPDAASPSLRYTLFGEAALVRVAPALEDCMNTRLAAVAMTALVPIAAFGQTGFPGVTSVFPLAVERGKTTVVTLAANRPLSTAYKALVSGRGVTAKVLPSTEPVDPKLEKATSADPKAAKKQKRPAMAAPASPANSCRVELTVAADAELGPHELRVALPDTLSTIALVYVSPIPAVLEKPANDKRETAQPLIFPSILSGRIEKTLDEDVFKFNAKAGRRASFSVVGGRMHNVIHKVGRFVTQFDPILSVTDSGGRELAVNDDYFFADSFLSFTPAKDGEYFLSLREATYKGNEMYTYALEAREEAQPTHTFPLAIQAKGTTRVKLLGPGFDQPTFAELGPPPANALSATLEPRAGSKKWDEVGVPVTSLPTILAEAETVVSGTPKLRTQKVTPPVAIEGTLERRGSKASFGFAAKKGQWYRFEVFARRFFSPLDAELRLYDKNNRQLATNDDLRLAAGGLTKDAGLAWQAPSDMEVRLELRDMMGKGSPNHVYHLEMSTPTPDFDLTCDPQLLMVGQGGKTAVFARADRKFGFAGAIDLAVEGLPPGVKASKGRIPADQQDGCIVLEAASDAKLDASNIRIVGKASVNGKELQRAAVPLAEIYQAQRTPVETVAVAIVEKPDAKVTIKAPAKISLKPGESATIPVKVERGPNYKTGPINLYADWRFETRIFGRSLPTVVTLDAAKSKTALIAEQTEGVVVLTAAAGAKPTKEPVRTTVIAFVPLEYSVGVVYCSTPFEVEVLPGEAKDE